MNSRYVSVMLIIILILGSIASCSGRKTADEAPVQEKPAQEKTGQIEGDKTEDSGIQAQNINVDVAKVFSDVSHKPVGIDMDWLDNSDLFHPERKNTIESALKSMSVGTLRFPYGHLADNYRWHTPDNGSYEDAVNGLKPSVFSLAMPPSTSAQYVKSDKSFINDMDFDEFMAICKRLNAEPVIMVSALGCKYSGGPSYEELRQSAAEWVRYANKVRGYGVKYWEIGNEIDIEENRQYLSKEEYALLFKDFARAMKEVDPGIKVGIGGTSNKEWFSYILQNVSESADFVVAHQYTNNLTVDSYSSSTSDFINNCKVAIDAIEKNAKPEDKNRLTVMITEFSSHSADKRNAWGNNDNTLIKSLCTFEMAANMICQPKITQIHFWGTHSPWGDSLQKKTDSIALDSDNNILPQGMALKVLAGYLNEKMVYADRVSKSVRTYASYTPANQKLTVWLLNKDKNSVPVKVSLNNYTGSKEYERWIYTGKGPVDLKPSFVKREDSTSVKDNLLSATLEPYSITVFTFKASEK